MMWIVRGNQQNITFLQGAVSVLGNNGNIAIQQQDFVFKIVCMVRRVPAGGKFKNPHCKGWCIVGRTKQDTHLHVLGAIHIYILQWYLVNIFDNHEKLLKFLAMLL